MYNVVRARIEAAPNGSWFRPENFGGGAGAAGVLAYLSRDADFPLVAAAEDLYFKGAAPDPIFGKQKPSPVATALERYKGHGVGPANADAVSELGLTTQVPPIRTLTFTGGAIPALGGVRWELRKNADRNQLNYTEIAVVEALSMFPASVEVPWAKVVLRIRELVANGMIQIDRLRVVMGTERDRPNLQENFDRLCAELANQP